MKINELYDILPISGVLEPGEIETVEITFNGMTKDPPQAMARCVVDGGPSYSITMRGDTDDIFSKVVDDPIDFG